jgi:hypothetical protein
MRYSAARRERAPRRPGSVPRDDGCGYADLALRPDPQLSKGEFDCT